MRIRVAPAAPRPHIAAAAAILTVPWAIWHAPLFVLKTGMAGMPPIVVPGFVLGLFGGAAVLGWLYENSGADVPVVALFHATLSLAGATTGTVDVGDILRRAHPRTRRIGGLSAHSRSSRRSP